LCLEYLLELADAGENDGALTDLGTGSGVLAIAATKLGWSPVSGYDHEAAAIEASAANAAINGVAIAFHRQNLRESLPGLAPTCVANMTSPILKAIAGHLSGLSGETRRNLPAVVPPSLPRESAPALLVLSGILPNELDEVAEAFAPAGYGEQDRRQMGDWAALLLRQGL
jgi:ribosomal protein L11 methyltransferase